ncbi:MAG: flagellar M-ring protein FliF [Planctomycetaceae bacterium]|nr:flagellar M-ring protein FliF [Planctomycetaceae bacterium]MCB9952615.1 flagellar M-ring protein FliF [Planctomycetaceae bacterium]
MSNQTVLENLTHTWKQWSTWEQVRFTVATVACLLAVGGVVYWAVQPEYVLLAENLTPSNAHEAVSSLEEAGIGYQLGFAGTAIYVAKSDVNRSRLALRDVVTEDLSTVESSGMANFWPDPDSIKDRQVRAQEVRLAKSISQFRAVRSATVHITPVKASPFIREREPAKASVVLELGDSGRDPFIDTQAIVSLVVGSVEGLNEENLSVLDSNGHVLFGENGASTTLGSQLEVRNQLEMTLSSKAESLLTHLLGENKARVRVTADVDFTELEREEHIVDPDRKAVKSETIKSEETTGVPVASGAAGSPSNIGRNTKGPTPGSTKSEDIDTTYENSTTIDKTHELPGRIKRLTVAAVVELPEVQEGDTTPAITKDQVEDIIKQAVGFDASRQDSIEVVTGKLQVPSLDVAAPTWIETSMAYEPIVRAASLGIGAILAFIMGLLILRKLSPVVVKSDNNSEQTLALQRELDRLKREVEENPDHIADVMMKWLSQDSGSESSPSTRKIA